MEWYRYDVWLHVGARHSSLASAPYTPIDQNERIILSLHSRNLMLSSSSWGGGRERARGRESARRAGAGAPDRRRVCVPYLCWLAQQLLSLMYTVCISRAGAGDGAGRRATARRRARAPRGAGRVSGVSRVWPAGCGRARDARAARRAQAARRWRAAHPPPEYRSTRTCTRTRFSRGNYLKIQELSSLTTHMTQDTRLQP